MIVLHTHYKIFIMEMSKEALTEPTYITQLQVRVLLNRGLSDSQLRVCRVYK